MQSRFISLSLPIVVNVAGFVIPPYALHDATIFGPNPGYYWMVHHLSFWTSNSGSFPYSAYVLDLGALQALKQTIANIDATSAQGLGYCPAFFGTSIATSQAPIAGIHKVGQTSGAQNDGSFGLFQSNQLASTSNPQAGGTVPYANGSRRKFALPSGWSIYCVATGNAFGGCESYFNIVYQQFKDGCKPDTWGLPSPFRGGQLSDIPDNIFPTQNP